MILAMYELGPIPSTRGSWSIDGIRGHLMVKGREAFYNISSLEDSHDGISRDGAIQSLQIQGVWQQCLFWSAAILQSFYFSKLIDVIVY